MEFVILFVFGLFVGSFLNVLIDRLAADESIFFPRSHCDFCKKPLAWYDLIPVFSFVFLRGKCRFCHSPISIQYPVVELVTGSMFVAVFQITNYQLLITLIYYLFIVSSLIVIFFTDLKYGIIPDKIVFPSIVVSFVVLISQYPSILISHFFSALGAFLFFLAIYLISHGRGMGFGDVKLSFLLGLFFGFPQTIYVLYIAFLTGALFSIILIILRKKRLKETIVFGPFLVIASLLVLFFGAFFKTVWFLPG